MLTRTLRIALLLSIGLHIVGMSIVSIVTPTDLWPKRQYTKVDFLGPILRKTAFDIMLESATPVVSTTYRNYSAASSGEKYLKTSAPKLEADFSPVPKEIKSTSLEKVEGFLSGEKQVPETILDVDSDSYVLDEETSSGITERKVVFKPDAPLIVKGQYGDKQFYMLKVKVLISSSGKVLKVEPLTTSGFTGLDLVASKYVKTWVFEPKNSLVAGDQWQEVDVILYTVEA